MERFLIACDARRDVDGRGNGIFDIRQKLLLGVEPSPGLENVRARLGLRPGMAQTYVRPYAVVEALHARFSEAVRVAEDEGRPGS